MKAPFNVSRLCPVERSLLGTVGHRVQLESSRAASILAKILMTTSVHIPKPLLEAVDRRAKALKISRNRLIVKALERELSEGSDWSAGFFEDLSEVDPATADAVDEMLVAVRTRRRSKAPRQL